MSPPPPVGLSDAPVLCAQRPQARIRSTHTGTAPRTAFEEYPPAISENEEADAASPPPVAHEHWGSEPEEHDYPAARSYLSLVVGDRIAAKLVKGLMRTTEIRKFAAKDILRAADLPLLGTEDSEVAADLAKVQDGKVLSPVLLVAGAPLLIADGYHRVCASYHLDEKALVACRIVERKSDPA